VTANVRFLATCLLLAATTLFLRARHADEFMPPRRQFASFPYRLGAWVGSDVNVDPDILQVLGSGDFLTRDYHDPSADDPGVDLFVAYFPTQRAGDTIHSPKNCLPSAGWTPVDSSRIEIDLPGMQPFLANRYVIAKGSQRGLVLYWYLAHGRAIAGEYSAKFYLVRDSIRMNRSDGSLIRVSTELGQHENAAHAQQRLLSLLTVVYPVMDAYVPR
jgi:EpsI family protein